MSVKFDAEQWLAIRKEAGLKIDPETAEVYWTYAQTEDPYGIIPTCPMSGSKSDGSTSLALPEAYGSTLMICPKQRQMLCGKG
jgi:hypothetical protein